MRSTARAAGRDADALQYTRWGAIDMSPEDVAADQRGTTRLVVGPSSTDPVQQRDELSAFAERLGLASTTGLRDRQRVGPLRASWPG